MKSIPLLMCVMQTPLWEYKLVCVTMFIHKIAKEEDC